MKYTPGVSISTYGRRNMSAALLIEVGFGYFLLKEEETSLSSVVNKNIYQNLKENVIMMCFHEGSLTVHYALVKKACECYLSVNFSQVYLCRFTENLLTCKRTYITSFVHFL